VIVPRVAFHVTAVLAAEPCTVALNGNVLPTIACAVVGEIATEVTSTDALPCSGMTTGLALALVIRLNVPSTEPAAVASNVTVKFCVAPGASDSGVVNPVTPNPVPDTCAWLTFRAAVPVLLAATDCEPITPTELDTVTLVGLTVIWGAPCGAGEDGGVAGALLTDPAHPKPVSAVAITTTRNTNSTPRVLGEEPMIVNFPLRPESLSVASFVTSGPT